MMEYHLPLHSPCQKSVDEEPQWWPLGKPENSLGKKTSLETLGNE